jgi:hypothetical protein
MMMTKSITTSDNAPRGVSSVSFSSLLVYLHKEYFNEEKEIRTWPNNQQQQHNTHTFQRRKISNHSDNSISYRTYRMRPLLAYHVEYFSYILSWLWQHHNTTTTFDVVSRRTVMSFLCKDCGQIWLHVDPNIRSPNGKCIPLTENGERHNCPKSIFNLRKQSRIRARAVNKSEIKKIDDWAESKGEEF